MGQPRWSAAETHQRTKGGSATQSQFFFFPSRSTWNEQPTGLALYQQVTLDDKFEERFERSISLPDPNDADACGNPNDDAEEDEDESDEEESEDEGEDDEPQPGVTVVCTAQTPLQAGQQMYISYGRKLSLQLLLTYGYIPSNNVDDVVFTELIPAPVESSSAGTSDSRKTFVAAEQWCGARDGCVFKMGALGLGYARTH